MSIVISVKANDGIVLAANSLTVYLDCATLPPRRVFNNSHRIFDLTGCGLVGAIAFGIGGIGSDSVSMLTTTLCERLKRELTTEEVNSGNCTVGDVARRARELFFEECYLNAYPQPLSEFKMGYRICGFSPDASFPEIWEFTIDGSVCTGPYEVQPGGQCGVRWAGENRALDRLLLGEAGGMKTALLARGYSEEDVQGIYKKVVARLAGDVERWFASTESSLDVARFLIELAPSLLEPEKAQITEFTEIAAITRADGFHWVLHR